MLHPLNDKVVLKLLEEEQVVMGGIIVLKQTSEVVLCEVIATDDNGVVSVGDKVLAPLVKMAKTVHGYIVDSKDLLAIVE